MAPLRTIIVSAAQLLAVANAHMVPTFPKDAVIGTVDEDKQPNKPCGGGSGLLPATKFHEFPVTGGAIGWSLEHPSAAVLIRATLDTKGAGGWKQLGMKRQKGHGDVCFSGLTIDKSFLGKNALIGYVVKADSEKEALFECLAVKFVDKASSPGTCVAQSSATLEKPNARDIKYLGAFAAADKPPTSKQPRSTPSKTSMSKTDNSTMVASSTPTPSSPGHSAAGTVGLPTAHVVVAGLVALVGTMAL